MSLSDASAKQNDAIQVFRAVIEDAGLRPTEIIADGELHRCPVVDKPRSKDGAYIFHPDPPASGFYENHRTGQRETWTTKGNIRGELNPWERRAIAKRINEDRIKRQAEQHARWSRAAQKAMTMLAAAKPCGSEYPYLKAKAVSPCKGLFVDASGCLLVPVLGWNGQVQSLQTISPNGQKRFLSGGKASCGYFPISGKQGPILICEGLATGLSLYEATEFAVLVAFNSGNLEAVALMARERYPEKKIMICGDDDRLTEGNPGQTKAQAAARAAGGLWCLPQFDGQDGTDFNDLHQAVGVEAVKAQIEAAVEPEANQWPEPVPFDDYDVPPLPISIFPDWARTFCQAAADHLQVATCMVTANVLGAVATCIAGKLSLEVKPGYREPLNLYILAPAPPAERKTGTQRLCFSPLYEWETEQFHGMRDEIRKASSQRKNEEAIVSGLRSKLAKAESEERQELLTAISELEADLTEIPHPPRLLADDITPEATAVLMAQQNEHLGVVSCEGGFFDILAGRYSSGMPNLDLVLKAHAGEPVRVDRKGGLPILMDAPALTLCLSPQPEVLSGLSSRPGFRGRGLVGRFIYILPESLLGRRQMNVPSIPTEVQKAYEDALCMLLNMPWGEDEYGKPVSQILRLEPGALQAWIAFADFVEPELAEGGRFETMRDWAGKLPGLAARLAGNLHVMEHLQDAPKCLVSASTMEKALELASALVGHALAAYGLLGADPDIEAAKYVLGWIKRTGMECFTQRDCHRGVRGRCPKAVEVKRALEILEERGYIQRAPEPQTEGPGRRPSPSYTTNPVLLGV